VATVTFEGVTKDFPNGVRALDDLKLSVRDAEFLVLVGPSGCGKTTALRMVAGLEDPSSGILRIGGNIVNDYSPKERDVAMVFQNYALYPHMTVAKNIGFALRFRNVSKDVREQKVKEAAQVLGLSELLSRKPSQLSGGQRQRVAMGRAIVREPAVFLMDEPLSNLDAKLRVQMRAEILRIQGRLGVTTIYVTHDQTEAMTMGDRVAILQAGRLQQCDAPQVLYDRPANMFVAAFMGSPSMNLYEARLDGDAENPTVRLGSQRLHLPPSQVAARPTLPAYRNRRLVVGIRPEHFSQTADTSDGSHLHAEVELVEALGNEVIVHFHTDARRIGPEDMIAETHLDEEPSGPAPSLSSSTAGTARLGPTAMLKPRDRCTLTVDTEHLHLFDADTGDAIWC
jgi:multiple sugar transport system ATP-binding protein